MRTIKMSRELFDFLKENRKAGKVFACWPQQYRAEFIPIRENDNTCSLIVYYANETLDVYKGQWKEVSTEGATPHPTNIYSLADDVELEKEIEYDFYNVQDKTINEDIYPFVTKGVTLNDMTSPNTTCFGSIPVNQMTSFEAFAGYEYERYPGEFFPQLNYNRGTLKRVRFIKK